MRIILALFLGVFLCGCSDKKTKIWIEQTQSKDASLRLEAVRALATSKPGAAEVLPALTKLLTDDNAPVRRAAAQALGSMGTAAQPAVPSLLLRLEDDNTGVRKVAALALKRIDPDRQAK
jgi:HEAT repeat protein